MEAINEAIKLALKYHRSQFRKDGHTPYVIHPLRVGFILQGLGASSATVCAGIVHDLIEDTPASWDTLNGILGRPVADIVVELSEDKRLPRQKRKAAMLAHLNTLSPEAKLVKLADRLDNLQEIEHSGWSQEKVNAYVQQAEAILKALGPESPPLAEKLGEAIRGIKNEG